MNGREIEELTERLVAERQSAEESARLEREEAAAAAEFAELTEASEFISELERLAGLTPRLLRERQDRAELITVSTLQRKGLLRKAEWQPTELPAWEVAAGAGTEILQSKEGARKVELVYRFMLVADGRVAYASESATLTAKPRLPSYYHGVYPAAPPRSKLAACGLASAGQVAARIEALLAGEYREPIDWDRGEEAGRG